MTTNSHHPEIKRGDYPIIVVIAGIAAIVVSFVVGGEFAFFVTMPMSVVIIGVGAVLTRKRADTSSGIFAKYHRPVSVLVATILLSILAYFLIILIPGN